MKSMADGYGYNERIFESKGLRSYFHLARFRWLRRQVAKHYGGRPVNKVMELGCFDAKSIKYLPAGRPPRYLGYDANWEGGLDLAKAHFAGVDGYEFRQIQRVDEFWPAEDGKFEIAISMETLEHLPPSDVEVYLDRIAAGLDGYFFITVPNEKGIFFLLKWLGKRLLSKDGERYSAAEVLYATLGRMDRVERSDHKGFDWEVLLSQLAKRFEIVNVGGHPLGLLPTSLCFSVGIVARSLAQKEAASVRIKMSIE